MTGARAFRVATWMAAAIFVAQTITLIVALTTQGHSTRRLGFGFTRAGSITSVTSVTPGLPVQAGDVIIAIDGQTVGGGFAGFALGSFKPGDGYTLTVNRAGTRMNVAMLVGGEPLRLPWYDLSMRMAGAVLLAACGLLIAIKKPDVRSSRWAALACWLMALNFNTEAGRPLAMAGWDPPWLLHGLRGTGTLIIWTAIRFLIEFPTPIAQATRWKRAAWPVLVLDLAGMLQLWISVIGRVMPLELTAILFAFYTGPLSPTTFAVGQVVETLFLVGLLLWRLRTVREPQEILRFRWLLAPIALAVAIELWDKMPIALGLPRGGFPALLNAVPPMLAYAILSKQVLGFSVVVRRTLQYVLTRPLVELALLVPIVLALGRGMANPNTMVSQLVEPWWILPLSALGVVLFPLVRARLLAWIDQRFFRAAWMDEQLVDDLVRRARSTSTVAELAAVAREGIEKAWHPERVWLFLRQRRGGPLHESQRGFDLPGEWAIVSALAPGAVVIVDASWTGRGDEPERSWLTGEGIVLAVPIVAPSGALSGALLMSEKKSHVPYSAADRRAAMAVTHQIGLLHDHALLELEQSEIVVAERTRIARELHDTLAQGFAGIGLHLDLGMRQAAQEQARWHMEQARQLATESLAAARRSVHDLRVMTGTGTDLGEMIKAMASQLAPKFAVHCEVTTNHSGPVPLEISQQLFRIAQESMTNIIKHSEASRVDIAMQVRTDRVWLEIRDNGRGFDPDGPRNTAYGVTGMRERARQINATLEVDSALGRGTVVRVTAPVPA